MCFISETRQLYNAFLVHFVILRRFVVVIHHNVVDGRLRFLNRFNGLLGQIQFLDCVLHLRDVRDDLPASISGLAVTQDQILDILLHQIRRPEICFWGQ